MTVRHLKKLLNNFNDDETVSLLIMVSMKQMKLMKSFLRIRLIYMEKKNHAQL